MLTHDQVKRALIANWPNDPAGFGVWTLSGNEFSSLTGLDWSNRTDAKPTFAEMEAAVVALPPVEPSVDVPTRVAEALAGVDPATATIADVITVVRAALVPAS